MLLAFAPIAATPVAAGPPASSANLFTIVSNFVVNGESLASLTRSSAAGGESLGGLGSNDTLLGECVSILSALTKGFGDTAGSVQGALKIQGESLSAETALTKTQGDSLGSLSRSSKSPAESLGSLKSSGDAAGEGLGSISHAAFPLADSLGELTLAARMLGESLGSFARQSSLAQADSTVSTKATGFQTPGEVLGEVLAKDTVRSDSTGSNDLVIANSGIPADILGAPVGKASTAGESAGSISARAAFSLIESITSIIQDAKAISDHMASSEVVKGTSAESLGSEQSSSHAMADSLAAPVYAIVTNSLLLVDILGAALSRGEAPGESSGSSTIVITDNALLAETVQSLTAAAIALANETGAPAIPAAGRILHVSPTTRDMSISPTTREMSVEE